MRQNCNILTLLVGALVLTACGGGGGGSSSSSSSNDPPENLSYSVDDVLYLIGLFIEELSATVDGDVDEYTVSPALPAGLVIDSDTGTISGTPMAPSAPTTHTVTATNDDGSSDFDILIEVRPAPRFGYVANAIDNTISIASTDAATGRLGFNGYVTAPNGETTPENATLHPNGRVMYVPNAGSANISVYDLDETTGLPTPRSPVMTGAGFHFMVLDPAGAYAYVTSSATDEVWTYSVDTQTGDLMAVGAPLATGNDPRAIALDPAGRFLFVGNLAGASMSVYDIDPGTGELSQTLPEISLNGAMITSLAVDPSGSYLLLAERAFDLVLVLSIDQLTGEPQFPPAYSEIVGDDPTGIVVHREEQMAMVTIGGDDLVRAYAFDSSTGLLSTPVDLPTGTLPSSVVFDESGLFAFVTNRFSDEVTTISVDPTTFLPSVTGTFRVGDVPSSIGLGSGAAVLPKAAGLYVANRSDGTVSAFRVDAADGSLTEVGSPVLTGDGTVAVAADPHGRFLYAVSNDDNTVSTFAIGPQGGLMPVGLPVGVSASPVSIAVDPSGRYAFVASSGANHIRSFAIDQSTGELSTIGVQGVAPMPASIAVHPTGRFLYATSDDSNGVVSSYRVSEGLFTAGPVTDFAPSGPGPIRFSPGGDFAYIPLELTDLMLPYTVDSTDGTLAFYAPGNVMTGQEPTSVAISPSGLFAFGAISEGSGDGAIERYAVGSDGGLTDLGDVFIGLNPRDLLIDPTGSYLYVANEGGDDVSVFSIDAATGDITLEGASLAGDRPSALTLTRTFE